MPAHLKWHYAGCFFLGLTLSMVTRGALPFGTTLICTVIAFAVSSTLKANSK